MFCPKCGNKVTDGEVFCGKCGAKLTDNNTTAQETESSGRQESVAAENTQAVPQNAVKAGKLQKFAKYGRVLIVISMALLFLSSFIRLPISPKILAVGAVLGIFLSALDIKKPVKFSRVMELIGAGIVVVVLVVVSLGTGSGGNDKYIQMVKSGSFEAYPQKTVGEAFDGFLGNPKWESGISEDGVRFVNVTGKFYYYDEEANIIVQFIIENEKTESFLYNTCELNGVPQNSLFFWGLLEAIYNDDSAATYDSNNESYSENRILIGEVRSLFDDEAYGILEVTLDYVEFRDKREDEYFGGYIYPDEGFAFLYVGVTLNNIGTKTTLLPASTVVYDGTYEFTESYRYGDNTFNIKPLSPPESAILIYMVPISAVESEKSLVLNINDGNTLISHTIRSGSNAEYDVEMQTGMSSNSSKIINEYAGSWSGRDYDRIFMEINYVDANGGYFDISISWSDSASEVTQWELQGAYMEEGGTIQYYGNLIEYYYYDNGEMNSEVVSEAEEGIIWIGDDGLLYWDDFTEPSGESYVLEKLTY